MTGSCKILQLGKALFPTGELIGTYQEAGRHDVPGQLLHLPLGMGYPRQSPLLLAGG